MSRIGLEIGSRVVLRAGATQQAMSSRFGRVVGLLPTDRDEPRYRVRVEGETFERCVLATDIEHAETATEDVPGAAATGPWFKPLSTKPSR